VYFDDARLARFDERDRKLHAKAEKLLPILPVWTVTHPPGRSVTRA
jgi:hypothetical protein